MLKRLAFSIVVLACATASLAQNDSTDKKKGATPTPTPTPAQTQAPKKKASGKLEAGDPAPALRVEKWIKGAPVRSFEKGRVYVVEFWATWCNPCQKSIPHLTELQEKHKDLTVIGVASSEEKPSSGPDRRASSLDRWVKAKGKQMEYTVAYEGDQQMYRDWMTAAGQSGIPCAFIIDGEGKIAWIGNPLNDKFPDRVERALKAAADKKEAEKEKKTKDKDQPKKPEKAKDPAKPTDGQAPKKDDK